MVSTKLCIYYSSMRILFTFASNGSKGVCATCMIPASASRTPELSFIFFLVILSPSSSQDLKGEPFFQRNDGSCAPPPLQSHPQSNGIPPPPNDERDDGDVSVTRFW